MSREARIFEMTLYKKLQQAIGRYSFIVCAPSVLGMSERVVALIPVGKNPYKKKDCTETTNSLPTIDQAATKNSFVKPSGPETLSLGRACKAKQFFQLRPELQD